MSRTRLACRAAAVALAALLPAVPCLASETARPARSLAAASCASVPAATGPAAAAVDFEELLRSDPAAALAQACAQFALADEIDAARRAALAVAEGLLVTERLAESRALLEAVRDEGPAPPSLQARILIALATLAHEEGDAAASADGFAQAREALQAAGEMHSRAYADVLVGLAAGWQNRRQPGDLDRADAVLDEAAALLSSLGLAQTRQMGDVLNFRTVVAHARDDLPGAVRWAHAEIALMRQLGLGDDPELLHALTTIGALESQLGHFDPAEAALREGLRLIALHPEAEPAGQLGIYNNLASLYRDRGDFAAALPVAERSVALARQVYGEGSARLLTPLIVRANAERNLALLAASRRSFEQALAIATQHSAAVGPVRRLRVYEAYAAVLEALGDDAAASAALDEAGRIVDAGDANFGYWQGRISRSRAVLAARARRWAEADTLQAEAAQRIGAVVGPHHPYVLSMLAERCVAQVRGALPGNTCDELAGLQGDLREAAPGFRFDVFAALAIAAESQGRNAEARERHLQALAAATSAGGPDPLWSAYDALATHLRARGERRLAIVAGTQAVEQIEAMRRALGADAQRLERGFLADKLATYRRLADWLTEDGRIDEALAVLRLLKQEEFHDFMRGDGEVADGGAAQRLRTPRDRRLFEGWERLREPAAANPLPLAAAPDLSASAASESQGEHFGRQAEAEAARVAAWREFLSANGQAAMSNEPVPSGPPPGAVAAGRLRVWAYPGESHLNMVLDSAGQREVRRIDLGADALARAVGRLLADIGRRAPVQAQLQALHTLIGAPIERAAARAGARRIELQLDGVLRYLPFAALHDGSRYLGERLVVEQRIETSKPEVAIAAGGAAEVRAVGVTRALAGMAPLHGLAREVCGIVDGPVFGLGAEDAACAASGRGNGALRGRAWLNEAFTAERLNQVVAEGRSGRHDLLHVGTHFVLRPGNMRRSWLLLGDGQRLYLDALAHMDFSGQDLVTLSACETGIGGGGADDGGSGQEIDGLNTLVMRRGARAVLASLWRVEDDSTSALMLTLYRELARRADPATALARAQAAVRSRGGGRLAHPFFWAGFYLSSGGAEGGRAGASR